MKTTLDDYLEERIIDWHFANQSCVCLCTPTARPCTFCYEGYSLPLATYIENYIEQWYIDHVDPHDNYDRAMKGFPL